MHDYPYVDWLAYQWLVLNPNLSLQEISDIFCWEDRYELSVAKLKNIKKHI